MAEKVLDVADKKTLDLTYAAVLNIGSDLTCVQSITTQILSAVLDSNSAFVTSNNVLKTFLSSETSVGSNRSNAEHKTDTFDLGTFTPKYDGSLRIKVNTKTSNANYPGYIIILEGGSQKLKTLLPKSTNYSESTYDVEVSKSVTYTVKINQDYMAQVTYCNYAAVCGDVQSSGSSELL